MGFFNELQQIKELTGRTSEAIGGVYADPFNEIATVISVSDPKKLGRVKVEYQDGTTSDWAYVLDNGRGALSAQLIGASCLVGKAHGNSGQAFILGFFNKNPNVGAGGAPVQLSVLDEQVGAYRSPASPGDQGMRCNKGNLGRVYLFQNESNQDVVVCIRRNNPQQGGEEVYNWKSLTNSKWIEKGFDPGVPNPTVTNFSDKKGIPECNEAMEGDVRDFAEDRKFRTLQIKCAKDENGDYNWTPASATPIFTRTLLPDCTEKTHGMDAVLDEGLNSQRVTCLRYQGQMKWINAGKREPIIFHNSDPPITKEEMLDSAGPVPAFERPESGMAPEDFAGNAVGKILDEALKAIPAVPSTSVLSSATETALDTVSLLTDIAKTVVSSNTETTTDDLVPQVEAELESVGSLTSKTRGVVDSLGGAGIELLNGVKAKNVSSSLVTIGQKALNQSINTLPSSAASAYYGYMVGGIAGAMDTTAALGLPAIPSPVAEAIVPVLESNKKAMLDQPKAVSNMVNSSVGMPGSSSYKETITAITDIVPMTTSIASEVESAVESGELGEVSGALSSFSSVPGMSTLPISGANIAQTAATILVGIGTSKQFIETFAGGIGLDSVEALLGSSAVRGLLLGFVDKLFNGGGGGDCPCGPKCRKTEHFEDSDGNSLLEKCGNVVANSSSSYSPDGDPTQNNLNEVAEALGRITTEIGQELCIPNIWDLTEMIQDVKRLGEMAERLKSAKDADWPEFFMELVYTTETIEKAFKKTDNNITKVESVERKLIDAQYRLINKLMVGNSSFFSQTLLSIITTSKAIRDVYRYVARLDATKDGGRAGVRVTDSLGQVFENITKIAKLNSASKKEANFITNNFLKTAADEWKDLNPAKGLVTLSDFVLGLVPLDLPAVFGKCATINDKNQVLKESLESKINSPVPPAPESLFSAQLPPSKSQDSQISPEVIPYIPPTASLPSISSLLDQINYEQGRAQSGEADC